MRTLRLLSAFCALLGLCALVGAQAPDPAKPPAKEKPPPAVKVGDKAPAIKINKVLDPKFKSMAELKGRLVLYEYFQHW